MEVKGKGGVNFGPFLYNYQTHEGLIKGLLDRAENKKEGAANVELAGVINDQRGYSKEDKEWFEISSRDNCCKNHNSKVIGILFKR